MNGDHLTEIKIEPDIKLEFQITEEFHIKNESDEESEQISASEKLYQYNLSQPLQENIHETTITNNAEKQFQCSICDYKCSQRCFLNKHILKHSSEKPFQCNLCGYTSLQIGNFKRHLLNHNGEKPYICNHKFITNNDLQKHMYTHTGEKPFHCSSKMDIIHELKEKSFSKLSYQEQLAIKEQGRPLPDIQIEVAGSSRGKSYKRQFNTEIYLRNDWICGCSKTNALFCFPCVLFGGEKSWTQNGVRDLVHLSEKIKKHENSKTHVGNQMHLAIFGQINIQAQLDSAYWLNIEKHNDNVTKNRYVLSKIINCIKFCGAFELALRGHNEFETLDNPGIFRGLINFSAELDKTLSDHLQNSLTFKGTSKEIQNDFLDCMLEVCHEEIHREIDEARFLAVIADETTDIAEKFQMVVILRYVTKDGEPVEHFWNFITPAKHDAETLAETILRVLGPILKDKTNKLIAQSYDGASVMSGQHGGVQAKIKMKYDNAHAVHCYAHQLNLAMLKASTVNSQVRVFFGNLLEIPAFFSHSPQRVAVLDRTVGRSTPTSWNFNICTVNVVYEHRDSLIECMEELETDTDCTTKTCSQASSIRRILQDPIFIFWLTFFHHVMPHVDILFNQLQKRKINPSEVKRVTSVFEQNVNNVRGKIDTIIDAANLETTLRDVKRKRPNNSKTNHRIAALEVCDTIINNAKERFSFTNHLAAASLFASENFVEYFNKFPESALDLTCSAYPILNKVRLRTELSVIYSNSECRKLCGAVPFLKFLISNKLDQTMVEVKKLLEILVTTPMTTPEAERCFSTLKRVKTFLRNSMCEDRLTALAMLSIEKKLISTIPNFNEKVIDKFAAKKNQRIPLSFKKMH